MSPGSFLSTHATPIRTGADVSATMTLVDVAHVAIALLFFLRRIPSFALVAIATLR